MAPVSPKVSGIIKILPPFPRFCLYHLLQFHPGTPNFVPSVKTPDETWKDSLFLLTFLISCDLLVLLV